MLRPGDVSSWQELQADGGGDGTGRFDDEEEMPAFESVSSRGETPVYDRRSSDFLPEREMYFDMDVALPFHWESMTGKGHKVTKSSESQDFEFNMTGNPTETVDKEISPADELFYKGQLLPLHLPKRLQMVQKLSSPKHTASAPSFSLSSDTGDSSSVTVSCFFQPSSLKYSALGSDESYLGSALVNSRSSSFHSQGSNNFWESDSPGDVDTGDSSSSRDSSGSSQDACVPDKRSQRAASLEDHVAYSSHCSGSKDRSFFQQREFFSHHNIRAEKSLFSSWLRSPFKWKVLLGLRRNSKSRNEDSHPKELAEEPSKGRASTESLDKKTLPREAAPPLEDVPKLNFSKPSGSHFSSAEPKSSNKKEAFSSSSALMDLSQSGLFLFPQDGGGSAAKEKSDSSDRSVSASKARESLHKYLSILKPLNGRVAHRNSDSSVGNNTYRVVDIRATTFSGDLTASPKHASTFSAGLPSPKAKSMSSPKLSFSDKKTPVMQSLSGNLRVPSFSRSSKASISAGNAAARAASPSHSGLLPRSSPSTMAELHSAIQGAIAHCKQSHAAKVDFQ